MWLSRQSGKGFPGTPTSDRTGRQPSENPRASSRSFFSTAMLCSAVPWS